MPFPASPDGGLSAAHCRTLCLLWLAGITTRVTILAVTAGDPVDPRRAADDRDPGRAAHRPADADLVRSRPIPGRAADRTLRREARRCGGTRADRAGRGGAPGRRRTCGCCSLATLLMGGGIAITQPAVPTLVHEWLPQRIGLGAAVYRQRHHGRRDPGPAFTIPLRSSLAGQSWRLALGGVGGAGAGDGRLFFVLLPARTAAGPAPSRRPRATGGRTGKIRWSGCSG